MIPVGAIAANLLRGGSGTSSDRWRINISAQGTPGNWLVMAEVEWLDAPGGTDLAVGGTASASDFHPFFPASLAFDNNMGTYWQSGFHTLPDQIEYDFGTSVTPAGANISIGVIGDAPTDFTLERYDGTTWQIMATFTGVVWSTDFETQYFPI